MAYGNPFSGLLRAVLDHVYENDQEGRYFTENVADALAASSYWRGEPPSHYKRQVSRAFSQNRDYWFDRIGSDQYRLKRARCKTPPREQDEGGKGLSDSELRAAVEAYLVRLRKEQADEEFSKSEANERLRGGALSDRTKASVEYLMQNISAVLEEDGLERIQGYVPAGNVGENVKTRIRSMIAETTEDQPPQEQAIGPVDLAGLRLETQEAFDPTSIEDARERTTISIAQRRGQARFRAALIRVYEGRCAISGSDAVEALEAAHVLGYKEGEATNHLQNGFLLRADLHVLFDRGLIAIDSANDTVVLAPALLATTYAELAGRPVGFPSNEALRPSAAVLDRHRQEAGL